jgi:hypothetical protein
VSAFRLATRAGFVGPRVLSSLTVRLARRSQERLYANGRSPREAAGCSLASRLLMRLHRGHDPDLPAPEARADVLVRQARRWRRRGEHRRAMVALSQACVLRQQDAALWTLYADACVRARRREAAADALGQALWLRQRARDHGRARVTRRLRDRVLSGGSWVRAA